MTDENENLILRLPRELGAEQQDQSKRLIRMEQRLDEVHESITVALDMAAHSNLVVEQHGQRFDELEDRLSALQKRMSDLEAKI